MYFVKEWGALLCLLIFLTYKNIHGFGKKTYVHKPEKRLFQYNKIKHKKSWAYCMEK